MNYSNDTLLEQTKGQKALFPSINAVIDHRLGCSGEYHPTTNEIYPVLLVIFTALLFVPLESHLSDPV